VPENEGRNQALTERDKMELMKEVSEHFKKHEFVKSIELIGSSLFHVGNGMTMVHSTLEV
jgi:rhombotail lipoprotein